MEILTPQQQLRKEIARVCELLKTKCESKLTHSIDVALIVDTTLPELKLLAKQLIALNATYD